jgi:hypothetical protein
VAGLGEATIVTAMNRLGLELYIDGGYMAR